MLIIKVFKNSAEPNRVDKSEYLKYISDISGVMREGGSISSMSIRFQSETRPNFNYVYIEEFGRYYFVSNIEFVVNNLWEIQIDVDVLMTYKRGIRNLVAFVDRNEFNKNPYILDKKRVIVNGCDYDVKTVENSLFVSESNGSYILTGLMIEGR